MRDETKIETLTNQIIPIIARAGTPHIGLSVLLNMVVKIITGFLRPHQYDGVIDDLADQLKRYCHRDATSGMRWRH